MKRWTDDEVDMFDCFSDAEIAEKTGRSVKAVSLKRQRTKGTAEKKKEYYTAVEKEARLITLCRKLGVRLFGTR